MLPPDSFLGRRFGGPVLLAFILSAGVAGAFALAWLLGPKPRPHAPADPAAAVEANNRGVGRMERFEYAEAAAEFDLAVRLDPDWTAARVNRGIALFNTTEPDKIAAAEQVFGDVLAREPDHRHARYCLGILAEYQNRTADAHAHFAAVRDLDPADAHTWLHLGLTHPAGRDSADGRACFEQALALNPYLNAARYALARAVMPTDPARGRQLLADHKALIDANWEAESRLTYGEMGRYADVIGRSPGGTAPRPLPLFEAATPAVSLAPDTRWATPADFGPGPVGDLRRAVRERFGGTVVLLDFNGDGRPDVLLLAAAVRDTGVGDLLLRNDGGNTFTDVTAAAGLAAPRPSLGAAAADYDNDGRPDLFVTGVGRQSLFRNRGDGTFEDVSAAAGTDGLPGVCLSAGWSDLDQDGDLDLVVCRYADGPEDALAALAGEAAAGGGLTVLLNAGVAQPGAGPPPPLTTKFLPDDRLARATPAGRPVGVVFTDADADRDADAVFLFDGAAPVTILNDRLLRFHGGAAVGPPGRFNGGLVVVGEHRERSDLFLVTPGGPPFWHVATGTTGFEPRPLAAPPLLQAVAADLDLDGRTDVLGLTRSGPLVLHNRGGRWEPRPGALGDTPAGPLSAAAADFDGDGLPDVLLWSAGVRVLRNLGNGNRAVSVDPTGRRDTGSNLRTNADALGAWVTAHAGPVTAAAERTTAAAGLGQSSGPTVLGVGPAARADAVRVRWPDGVIQAELGVPAGPPFRVTETNRKGTSCPVLLAWDGTKFAFVTDFLGAGALGELGPDGAVRPPRPEESVKIEPGRLVLRNGEYVLKIAEPMDEVLYLDRVELLAVDHPAGVAVFPDERFVTAGPPPSQEVLAFPTRYLPAAARDHRGRDVTAAVRDRDRVAADGFAPRSWLGYAEDHELRLEFAGLPAGAGGRWFLGMAGWTEYPYPESMFAATQAGVSLRPPVLERLAGGAWRPVCDLGFPAGLPRVMTREVPGPIPADGRLTVRVRTNMQVYWDQVFLAPAADATRAVRVTALPLSGAAVAARGFVREVFPGGRPPVGYDDSATEPVAVTRWAGNLTREGDVTDLLRATDDRFVLCGPGDEITVRFAAGPAALPAGWERSFVLRAWGYCKDTAPFTATGGRVGPLPFRGMTTYPPPEAPPATDAARWHTRPAGADS